MQSEGSFVAIDNRVSQSVPHLHIHIVPRRKKDGLRGFFWPRQKYESAAEMESVRNRVKEAAGAAQEPMPGLIRPWMSLPALVEGKGLVACQTSCPKQTGQAVRRTHRGRCASPKNQLKPDTLVNIPAITICR